MSGYRGNSFGGSPPSIPTRFTEVERMRLRPDFRKKGRCDGAVMHEVFIAVKQLNLDKLEAEALARSTPGTPLYQQWLSFEEVGRIKGNPAGSAAVLDWLRSSGVEVTWVSPHQEYIKATTSIGHWEQLLDTQFHLWENLNHLEQDHIPRAHAYSVPASVREHVHALFDVSNLPPRLSPGSVRSEHPIERTYLRHDQGHEGQVMVAQVGGGHGQEQRQLSSCSGCTTVQFLDQYYGIASNLGSADISQSVFETSGQSFSPSDLTTFQQTFGLTVQAAEVIGGHSVSSCNLATNQCTEGNLDIQYIMGVAQLTTSTYYYVSPNGNPFVTWITDVASSPNPPLVNSISWGSQEDDNTASMLDSFNNEAIALANMGVTVMVSSGDDGVSGGPSDCVADSSSSTLPWNTPNSWTGVGYFPSFPATCPWVTAVGATMGPNYGNPEIACQANIQGGVITTGGGFSSYYPAPSWQTQAVADYFASGVTPPASGYNPEGRGYPDVSLIGVNYPVIINGLTYEVYGTSASSPVFAAYVSLLNAVRLNSSLASIGFLNPTLYSGGLNGTLPNSTTPVYNDITSGDNKCCAGSNPNTVVCCSSGFYTAAGWDPVTGWGSIDFPEFAALFGSTVTNPQSPSTSSDGSGGGGLTTTGAVLVALLAGFVAAAVLYFCFRKQCSNGLSVNEGNANSPRGTAQQQRQMRQGQLPPQPQQPQVYGVQQPDGSIVYYVGDMRVGPNLEEARAVAAGGHGGNVTTTSNPVHSQQAVYAAPAVATRTQPGASVATASMYASAARSPAVPGATRVGGGAGGAADGAPPKYNSEPAK